MTEFSAPPTGPDEHFYSLLDQRSFINPVTNLTVISSFRSEDHLPALASSTLPWSCLPAFLHEATHHWCLMHPVGGALALLNLRARRAATALERRSRFGADDSARLVSDVLRYEAFINVQRPLAEGIAMFAECDLVPGTSLSRPSAVLRLVADCFGPTRFASDWDEPGERDQMRHHALNLLLQELRTGRAMLERKTNLLVQPMTCTTGGYLPGYLLVKDLWRVAMGADPRLVDSELFLAYLLAYIYADFGVIALLLAEDVHGLDTAQRLVKYVSERLQSFGGADHRAHVDRLLEQTPVRRQFHDEAEWARNEPSFGTEPELADVGRARLVAAMEELQAGVTDSTIETSGQDEATRSALIMIQRHLMSLGHADVQVEVDQHNQAVASADGRPLMEGPSFTDGLAGRRGNGSLDAYIDTLTGLAAVPVTLDDQLVLLWTSPGADEAWRRQLTLYRTSLPQLEEETRTFRHLLEGSTREMSSQLFAIENARDTALRQADAFYPHFALGLLITGASVLTGVDVPPQVMLDKVRAAQDAMRDNGFAGILGRVRLVRALAWTSLFTSAASTAASLEELRDRFADQRDLHGLDETLDEALDAVRTSGLQALGDPLVHEAGGNVLCTV